VNLNEESRRFLNQEVLQIVEGPGTQKYYIPTSSKEYKGTVHVKNGMAKAIT